MHKVVDRTSQFSHLRIGIQVPPGDPFWVQIREALFQQLHQLGVQRVPVEVANSYQTILELDPTSITEEILAQDIDVLISNGLSQITINQLLAGGLPIILLSEASIQHPLLVSPQGLYECGRMAGEFIATALGGQGLTLCISAFLDTGLDKGQSRMEGYHAALRPYPRLKTLHCPAYWTYEQTYPVIETTLRQLECPPDAIFGLSDSLALAAHDAVQTLGLFEPSWPLIVGVNGDPLALAAIFDGSMAATVETPPREIAAQAAHLALQTALRQPVPAHFSYHPRLVTAENVSQVAIEKLITIADIPTQLVGVNRRMEQRRLTQLETSLALNRRVGTTLKRSKIAQEIAELLRANYGYDFVWLWLWSEAEQVLVTWQGEDEAYVKETRIEPQGLLREVLQRREPIFIPDTRFTRRFAPDPAWPETRSRVILPVRLGEDILGVLDLHSRHPMGHVRQDLIGLQALADQLGVALRNAELYEEAVQQRAHAESADQLKTRLLANVSHELRAPLNIILGYCESALRIPNLYDIELPPALRRDLEYIAQSGIHLQRMINDLLDLSRVEIGALELAPEMFAPADLIRETFESFVHSLVPQPEVRWRLDLPMPLPLMQADPARLRQIILNLLSNAAKFTTQGYVALHAAVEPPHLHLWVEDTGCGIPIEQQERIFEPFVTAAPMSRPGEGIGLGLTITRRLVALHGGLMSLESKPGQGSIFHVYLPLPDLSGQPACGDFYTTEALSEDAVRLLLYVAGADDLSPALSELARRQGATLYRLTPGDERLSLPPATRPIALAWDVAGNVTGRSTLQEWSLIQRLRRHPLLSRLPFILFYPTVHPDAVVAATPTTSVGSDGSLTNILLKPVCARTLGEMLDAMRRPGMGGSVWVIDDDPEARKLYRCLATAALPDLEIVLIEGGPQALQLLGQVTTVEQSPRLVLLDLMMPEIDGFEVLKRLRACAATRHTPVIIISGKMLTFEDVQRLDYAGVTFEAKHILDDAEMKAVLQATCAGTTALPQPTSAVVKHALAYLSQNYAQRLTRAEICRAIGVSENYLSRIFKREVGLSPWQFLNRVRVYQAGIRLRTTPDSITAIAAQVGFEDSAYFSRVFHKQLGVSPGEYRAGKAVAAVSPFLSS
ncbi:MAG TPA: ATP-binding protein [Anaerolineae bacterium]|nr:ATP-binding protein [Anaerolineae bacterium]HQI84656.1 ATP-binding protein [Anaerolineae bacterium]